MFSTKLLTIIHKNVYLSICLCLTEDTTFFVILHIYCAYFAIVLPMSRVKIKLMFWFKRYLPSEILGTITALGGAYVAFSLTDSLIYAAVAGTLGENLGYYGYAATREVKKYYRRHHGHVRVKRMALTASHTIRSMLVEFGPAECLDSFLLRPFMLYIIPSTFSGLPVWVGWLIAKLSADIFFYTFAIIGYELHQRYIDAVATQSDTELND